MIEKKESVEQNNGSTDLYMICKQQIYNKRQNNKHYLININDAYLPP
jgi:hypothetical protein